jgi:RNA polymerase sigma factor (sigma-70 family)
MSRHEKLKPYNPVFLHHEIRERIKQSLQIKPEFPIEVQSSFEIRRRFIEDNLKLVTYHIRSPKHPSAEDSFQDGVLGLIEAVDSFDPNKGSQFDSYASRRIHGSIVDGVRKDKGARIISEINRFHSKFSKENHRDPTLEEIAAAVKTTVQDVLDALNFQNKISINQKRDDIPELSLIDSLPSGEPVDSELLRKDFWDTFRSSLSVLSERDASILYMYFFEGKKQKEIAALFKMSLGNVSRIIKDETKKLRNNQGLKEFLEN